MGADQSALNPKDLADLTRMTNFSDSELNNWYKEFKQGTSSRFLTRVEFIRIFEKNFPDSDPDKFADHVFRTFDVNKDDKLNFREFVIGLSLSMKGDFDEKLYWAFRLYDVDGNGFITSQEMKGILGAMYAICKERGTTEETQKAFQDMDANQDGQVSWAEFRKGVKGNKSLMEFLNCTVPSV